ncbi:uncharacterized protein NECHADRAFT_45239 [Fusarium vanettenii 77-13-4]|uniref:Rhodopsin domain-containing protein n=1 Tax=Fusarium vanettenii (strain ATCC MYA-4622 / CBS 123669 / FGSC 9596 / NRRL 45880 / 77-13-4) TaxID=660122 RepID=C7YXJ8_FUSV7|nr:uncharacterized protein NECHADRAFT_45239 [Fusarium vanettenii 77-13-4]EEU43355.1 hypothetical protein NECHADRAFT_45239 [Fusarium vanettenii 77-13-4]
MSPQSIEWTFMVLAYVFVACRLYVRLFMRGLRLYSADYWLIVGLMCCQGLLICDTLTYSMNATNDFTITSVSLDKIRFATNYFFDTGIYFPKFSIIAFYYSLTPPKHPEMRIALQILTFITGAFALITFFGNTFWCGPDPSVNWRTSDESCTVFSSMDLMRLNWSLNFITEVLNVAFPFPLIFDLSLRSRREKVALGVIFALGTITIGVSVGRFVTMLHVSNDISIYIWATAEICISVIVVALSALRPLLQKLSGMVSTDPGSNLPSGYNISSMSQPSKPSTRTRDLEAFWETGPGAHYSSVTAMASGEHLTGSEVELNGIGGILRTQQVSMSSETISSFMTR